MINWSNYREMTLKQLDKEIQRLGETIRAACVGYPVHSEVDAKYHIKERLTALRGDWSWDLHTGRCTAGRYWRLVCEGPFARDGENRGTASAVYAYTAVEGEYLEMLALLGNLRRIKGEKEAAQL
jgi:hypothetical protein